MKYPVSYIDFDKIIKRLDVHGITLDIKEGELYKLYVQHQIDKRNYYTSTSQFTEDPSISVEAFIKNGNRYLDSSIAISMLSQIGLPAYFLNLLNPKVTINGKLIEFEGAKPLIMNGILSELISNSIDLGNSTGRGYGYYDFNGLLSCEKLDFLGYPRKSYAIISFSIDSIVQDEPEDIPYNCVQIDIAQAGSNGIVSLPVSSKDMKFLTSYAEFKKQKELLTAIVLPLTGRLDKDLLYEEHPLLPLKR
jgi:hypothetical protein